MLPTYLYRNRTEAGRILGEYCATRSDLFGATVVGLARGGIQVAEEVARELDAPLETLLVRKVRLADQPEIAIGALAEGDVRIIDAAFLETAEIPPAEIRAVERIEQAEIERRRALYRGGLPPAIQGRFVILVDDGMTTGYTMRAAVAAAQHFKPSRIAVAVPVGARGACRILANDVHDILCPFLPGSCRPVRDWYEEYEQPTDEDVMRRLSRATLGRRRRLRAA